jgi:hypothetical protein
MNQVAKLTLTAGVVATVAVLTTINTNRTKASYLLASVEPQSQKISQNIRQPITLQTYDEASIPLKTSYPNNMTVFGTGSGEGVGVSFKFKPQGNGLDEAEISFFLPRGSKNAEEFETFVTGADGLMANNGWNLKSQTSQDSQFPYPWVKKIVNFNTNEGQTGKILLGDSNNQAIQVILLAPSSMTEVYWQSVKIILDNLEFKSELLPVSVEKMQ